MRNDEAGGPGGGKIAAAPARVEVHPAAGKAVRGMMSDMAVEFDRWMADEIEELAESIGVAAGSAQSPCVGAYLYELARQLARQAEIFGYPEIASTANRLSVLFGPKTATTPPDLDEVDLREVDLRIAELRHMVKR